MLFLFLLISSTKKAIVDVSKKANESVKVFASDNAQQIFNEEVFKSYHLCRKRAQKNKNINNSVESCEAILNEVSIPENGFLTKISHKFYHYNWLSEKFSTKNGKIVYKMTDKDKYLKSKRCFFMLAKKFVISIFTSSIFSVLFYFALILMQKLLNKLLNSTLSRRIGIGLFLFLLCYCSYKFNLINGLGKGNLALINGGISLSGDLPVSLKVIITIFSSLIVYKEFKINKYSLWTVGFSLMALIFNPIIPIILFLTSLGIIHFVSTVCEIFFCIYLIKEYKSFSS